MHHQDFNGWGLRAPPLVGDDHHEIPRLLGMSTRIDGRINHPLWKLIHVSFIAHLGMSENGEKKDCTYPKSWRLVNRAHEDKPFENLSIVFSKAHVYLEGAKLCETY